MNRSLSETPHEPPSTQARPVYVIDDEDSVRASCEFLISSMGWQVTTWASATDFIDDINISEPAVVVTDLMLPGMSGQALQDYLNARHSPIALIALTGNGEIPDAVMMLKKGAADYLEKPISSQKLEHAIIRAQKLTLKQAQIIHIKMLYEQLTDKEKQVARELMGGNLNKIIAENLEVSVRTVEVHRSHVMKKMQAQHVSELVQKLTMLGV